MSNFCYLQVKYKGAGCTRQCNTCKIDQRNKAQAETGELKSEIEQLKKQVEQEKSIAEFWRAKAVYENAGHVKYKTLFDSVGGLTINERR